MSKKIDKLKEINTQLNNLLIELETQVFVATGGNAQNIKPQKELSKVVPEPKR